jgi:ATP-dependent helicase HrpA
VVIPPEAWDVDKLPDHLRPTYRIVDEEGRLLGSGKDLGALQSELASSIAATLQQATSDIARDSLTDWDGDVLPRTVSRQIGGHTITGYPALVSEDRRVALRVLESEQRQDVAMWSGTRQLLVKTLPSPAKRLRSALSQQARLTLSRAPHGSLDSLFDDCVTAAVDSLMRDAGGPAWDRAGFEGLSQRVGRTLESESVKFLRTVERIFVEAQQVESRLASLNSPSTGSVTAEVAGQFAALIFPGFVTATQALQLSHLPRYLKAMQQRLNDAPTNLVRDRERQAQVDLVVTDFAELRARLSYAQTASLEGIRWMIEELRVSLFAQRLGTAYPVSVARIHKAMDELDPL